MSFLSVPLMILRNTKKFFADLRKSVKLESKIKALFGANLAFFGIYGAIIGAFSSVFQSIASAIKLPLLFLLTLLITFPTLYIFNLLFGARQSIKQYFTLILSSTAIMSVLVLGFAPITILFMITSDHYQFFKLLNVTIFAISCIVGMKFFYTGMGAISQDTLPEADTDEDHRLAAGPKELIDEGDDDADQEKEEFGGDLVGPRNVVHAQEKPRYPNNGPLTSSSTDVLELEEEVDLGQLDEQSLIELERSKAMAESRSGDNALTRKKLLRTWIVLYAFVGSQLSWVMRPFFGAPGEDFDFIRDLDGNFFTNIIDAIARILGFK